jgi:hypothetical protein
MIFVNEVSAGDMVTCALFTQPLHNEDHRMLHNHAPATYRSFSGMFFSTLDGFDVLSILYCA